MRLSSQVLYKDIVAHFYMHSNTVYILMFCILGMICTSFNICRFVNIYAIKALRIMQCMRIILLQFCEGVFPINIKIRFY